MTGLVMVAMDDIMSRRKISTPISGSAAVSISAGNCRFVCDKSTEETRPCCLPVKGSEIEHETLERNEIEDGYGRWMWNLVLRSLGAGTWNLNRACGGQRATEGELPDDRPHGAPARLRAARETLKSLLKPKFNVSRSRFQPVNFSMAKGSRHFFILVRAADNWRGACSRLRCRPASGSPQAMSSL